MPNVERYTEELLKKGEERRRLTKQLAELVGAVADKIANTVPLGTTVTVAGKTYEIIKRTSNLASVRYLAVAEGFEDYEVITADAEPGDSFYLHNDFRCRIHVADRNEYLFFANHLPEIIASFEAEEEKIITALRQAFDRLRSLVGED